MESLSQKSSSWDMALSHSQQAPSQGHHKMMRLISDPETTKQTNQVIHHGFSHQFVRSFVRVILARQRGTSTTIRWLA
jgi:hypothetical protein